MALPQVLEKNKKSVALLAGGVLLIAVCVIVFELRGSLGGVVRANKVYFYDLGSSKIIIGTDAAIPPIPAPSGQGNSAVRAYVYSCGDCKDPGSLKVAYLEEFSSEALGAMKKAGITSLPVDWAQTLPADVTVGWMVRGPDQKDWVSRRSQQGNSLTDLLRIKCDGQAGKAQECLPSP